MNAPDFLKAGLHHMQDRAVTYDKPQGERSMGMTVALANVLLAEKLREPLSEEDGWNFMELLKLVRSKQGEFKADNYEDRAAYAGLAGEAAHRERREKTHSAPESHSTGIPANPPPPIHAGHEVDTDFDTEKTRMPQVGTNGNEGEHYAPALPAGFSWADAPPDANVLVMYTETGVYYWADAFSDGARIYGALFDQMGLSRNSGWKLIARRPGSDPGWVYPARQRPNLPWHTLVEVMYRGIQLRRHQQIVDDVDWAGVAAYRVVEALEQ